MVNIEPCHSSTTTKLNRQQEEEEGKENGRLHSEDHSTLREQQRDLLQNRMDPGTLSTSSSIMVGLERTHTGQHNALYQAQSDFKAP